MHRVYQWVLQRLRLCVEQRAAPQKALSQMWSDGESVQGLSAGFSVKDSSYGHAGSRDGFVDVGSLELPWIQT